MATDSDSTLVDSCDEENEDMLISEGQQPQNTGPKEAFNPFLLVPSTSMFGGINKNDNADKPQSSSPKKSRRKRKGEGNVSVKEKRDKKQETSEGKSTKKTNTGTKIFPDFWASVPDSSGQKTAFLPPSGEAPELNLNEAISGILVKHQIDGRPAEEIKELMQIAVGQICALRSSVLKMEDRLSKLEGKMNPPEQEKTYAKAVMASTSSDFHPVSEPEVKRQDKKSEGKQKQASGCSSSS
ncbi:hypothetical protein AVEN_265309-1 [Araneus ventricosus]|uniref:Uncharacterized protein n=1 Tax=Araneus ventricosus TaxID=182803 RepID=A0A4Y2EIE6_ARAVE|nr:hypothetical protein AVEN_265309-1 [Araneus ventricosus]